MTERKNSRKLLAVVTAVMMLISIMSPMAIAAHHADGADYLVATPLSSFVVTFDPTGGSMLPGQEELTITGGSVGANMPTEPLRDGYVFLRWLLDGVVFTGETPVTESITVVAEWGFGIEFLSNNPRVTLNVGDDPNNPAHFLERRVLPGQTVDATDNMVWVGVPPVPTGERFLGWFDSPGVGTGNEFTGTTPIARNITLYAQWEPLIWRLDFDPGLGTIDAGQTDHRFVADRTNVGESYSFPYSLNQGVARPTLTPLASRAGMELHSWWSNYGDWNDSEVVNALPDPFVTTVLHPGVVRITQDHTFHALWMYRVAFVDNAGRGLVSDINRYVMPSLVQTNGHATFEDFFPLNPNHPSSGGVMPVTGADEGSLIPNPVARPGFEFMGWWSVRISDNVPLGSEPPGAYIITADSQVTGSRSVWARWRSVEAADVRVTFDISGGEWVHEPDEVGYRVLPLGRTISNTLGVNKPRHPAPVNMPGYMFAGWYLDSTLETPFTTVTVVTEDITVFARWSPYHYVTTIYNAETRNPGMFRVVTGETAWFSIRLFIQENGGLNENHGFAASMFEVNNFWNLRPGSTATRWTTGPLGQMPEYALNNQQSFVNGTRITDDITRIYLHWEETVIFDTNVSSHIDGSADQVVLRAVNRGRSIATNHINVFGNEAAQRRTMPEATLGDWALVGWNTERDGSGEWFNEHTIVTERTYVYAIFQYRTVVFNSGFAPQEVIAESNQSRFIEQWGVTIPQTPDGMPPAPQWEGHEFRGWNTVIDGSGITYGETTVIHGPRTLFAAWRSDVIFNPNGGTLSGAEIVGIDLGRNLGGFMPADPANGARAFLGWNTESDGSGEWFSADDLVLHGMEVFAQWDVEVCDNCGNEGNCDTDTCECEGDCNLGNCPCEPVCNDCGQNPCDNDDCSCNGDCNLDDCECTQIPECQCDPNTCTCCGPGCCDVCDCEQPDDCREACDNCGQNPCDNDDCSCNGDCNLDDCECTQVPECRCDPNTCTCCGPGCCDVCDCEQPDDCREACDNCGQNPCDSDDCSCEGDCNLDDCPCEPICDNCGNEGNCDTDICECEGDCNLGDCPCEPTAQTPAPGNQIPGGGGGAPPAQQPASPTETPAPPATIEVFSPRHDAFIVGFPDGTVRPEAPITRAQAATIFFRLLSDEFRAENWSQGNPFDDVGGNAWFNNAISTLHNAGIINGSGDGTVFRPNDAITRAEFAAMTARFFEWEGHADTDLADVSGTWAERYIGQLSSVGWVQGDADGAFNPDEFLTRAQASAIINRMLDRTLDSTDGLLSGRTRWPDKTNMNAWYYLYLQEATHSTEFERLENGNLAWTEILPHLDWSVLERPSSQPWHLSTVR